MIRNTIVSRIEMSSEFNYFLWAIQCELLNQWKNVKNRNKFAFAHTI